MRTTPPGAQALGGLPGDPQGGSKPFPQGCRAVPPPTPAGPLGGLCGGRSHEAGFSKGLRCSWPFVCMNYRCPPQVAGHGSPSGAPHWSKPSGLSALVSTQELPTPSSPLASCAQDLSWFSFSSERGWGKGCPRKKPDTPACVC